MNIYFAGAIRGGREKVNDYQKIVEVLKEYGNVLTEHVANPKLTVTGEGLKPEEVYERDVKWLDECDILFAEISVPSLGVGYELAYAESKNKPIICMYEEKYNVSGMIRGNRKFKLIKYNNIENLLEDIRKTIKNEEGR